jgi:glutamine amidotransferase/cyclase
VGDRRVYFVHSYRATPSDKNADWVLATTCYGDDFISAVQKGETYATQFHPEKSGGAGLDIIRSFLEPPGSPGKEAQPPLAHGNGARAALANDYQLMQLSCMRDGMPLDGHLYILSPCHRHSLMLLAS